MSRRVDRRGGAEEEVVALEFLRDLQQVNGADDIVLVVLEWLLDGFPHCLESSEVNNKVDRVGLFVGCKQLPQLGNVPDVDLMKGKLCLLFNFLDDLYFAVGKVVNNYKLSYIQDTRYLELLAKCFVNLRCCYGPDISKASSD